MLDLDPYGGTDPLGCFLFFLRELLMLWPPRLSVVFRQLVRRVVSRLAEDHNVAPIPKGPPPLLLTITDQFPFRYCLRCLRAWCRFVLDDLWNAVVCFQPQSLLIGKVWVPVMTFVQVPYIAECIGEWTGGSDRTV